VLSLLSGVNLCAVDQVVYLVLLLGHHIRPAAPTVHVASLAPLSVAVVYRAHASDASSTDVGVALSSKLPAGVDRGGALVIACVTLQLISLWDSNLLALWYLYIPSQPPDRIRWHGTAVLLTARLVPVNVVATGVPLPTASTLVGGGTHALGARAAVPFGPADFAGLGFAASGHLLQVGNVLVVLLLLGLQLLCCGAHS